MSSIDTLQGSPQTWTITEKSSGEEKVAKPPVKDLDPKQATIFVQNIFNTLMAILPDREYKSAKQGFDTIFRNLNSRPTENSEIVDSQLQEDSIRYCSIGYMQHDVDPAKHRDPGFTVSIHTKNGFKVEASAWGLKGNEFEYLARGKTYTKGLDTFNKVVQDAYNPIQIILDITDQNIVVPNDSSTELADRPKYLRIALANLKIPITTDNLHPISVMRFQYREMDYVPIYTEESSTNLAPSYKEALLNDCLTLIDKRDSLFKENSKK